MTVSFEDVGGEDVGGRGKPGHGAVGGTREVLRGIIARGLGLR